MITSGGNRRPLDTQERDRGTQYTSQQIANALHRPARAALDGPDRCVLGQRRRGVIWSTLKTELYNRRHWSTKADAKEAAGAWIEERYNRRRCHSSIGMVGPVRCPRLRRHEPPDRVSAAA